jgi:predicted lipoprotein with Yx(FWY)xxD motif
MRAQTATTSKSTNPSPGQRRRWTPSRRAILLGLVPAAAIAAACGSSSTTSSTNTTKAPTATTGSAAPTIQTANNSKFGTILVDGQGRTLYTLTNNGQAVACTGACTTVWPPSLLPSGQNSVTAGSGVSNVSTVSATGGQQVAYKGLALYRFSGDAAAGAANGDGINSFGGIWHVVKIGGGSTGSGSTGGSTATTGGSGTTSTTFGGGSSGGGY